MIATDQIKFKLSSASVGPEYWVRGSSADNTYQRMVIAASLILQLGSFGLIVCYDQYICRFGELEGEANVILWEEAESPI